jgi:hypothetical protein
MTEKKQVLYDLRNFYSGPFIVEDLFKAVDNWILEKGYAKEVKKKLEHVAQNGKKIQWILEIHSHLEGIFHGSIMFRASLENVKEVVIKRKGKKIRVNNGDVHITVEAFVEGHVKESLVAAKPVHYFIRSLIDRFFYPFWIGRHDGKVNSDGRELFKAVCSYLNSQKMMYL